MSEHYFAHGKLLLSGEYLVLKGAAALAVPTARGQSLKITPGEKHIRWTSRDVNEQVWFSAEFNRDLDILHSSDSGKARFLQKLLLQAGKLSDKPVTGVKLESKLDFPRHWGLGSSSTLTYLIAKWRGVDPFELFFSTQNGSGYDIACAASESPLIYELKEAKANWQHVSLPPVFQEVYFVHLNQKQQSHKEVKRFLQSTAPKHAIEEANTLSHDMLKASSVGELRQLMHRHEELLSDVLEVPPVQQRLFKDFAGAVKSLGAWGGDFVMALGDDCRKYFQAKGYPGIFSYDELVKQHSS